MTTSNVKMSRRLTHVDHKPSGGNQINQNKNGAAHKDALVQCATPISPVLERGTPKAHRAYVASELPLLGCHKIFVTNASTGPHKFTIQLKKDAYEFMMLKQKLNSTELVLLKQAPEQGIPCMVHHSNGVHRGLVISTNQDLQLSKVHFVDSGIQEEINSSMLYEIPDNLMTPHLFGYRVSLVSAEELVKRPGFNDVFASWVTSFGSLLCEVVSEDEALPRVHLYDWIGQNITETVLRLYSKIISVKTDPFSQLTLTTQSINRQTEVPEALVEKIEKLYVMCSEKAGHVFGQLEKRPPSDLDALFQELSDVYTSTHEVPLLYADVLSHQGNLAVMKLLDDGRYYRVRIQKELEHDAEVESIDFGFKRIVSRRELLAPVSTISNCVLQPAYGIHCELAHGDVQLGQEKWDNLLLYKYIQVRIGNKNSEGMYSVTFTDDPAHQNIVNALFPKSKGSAPDNAQSQPKLGSSNVPLILHVPFNPSSQPKLGSPHVPSTCVKSTAETPSHHSSKKKIEEVVTTQNSPPNLYQHPNRDSGTTKATSQRPATSVQEVVRNPRGPPPLTGANLQGHVHRREIKPVTEPVVKQVASLTTKETSQRSATPTMVEEVVRNPHGPPLSSNAHLQGPVGFFQREIKTVIEPVPSRNPVASPTLKVSSIGKLAEVPTIPVPTKSYTSLSTSRTQKVILVMFCGLDKFFLSPSDISSHQVELKSLHESYAFLPANELVEDSPKVGLPCVVRFEDDRKFYRALITAILEKQKAKVLFVDYGNEQETSLADIKRILPKYMKPPRLAWHCKLAGIGFPPGKFLDLENHLGVTLCSNDEMIATFHSVDKNGVNLVKIEHPFHGDVADYLVKSYLVQLPKLKLPLPITNFTPGELIAAKGCISFVESSSEFWIQRDPEAVESLVEKINALDLRPDFYKDQIGSIAVGDPCLAFYPQDQRYYRASVERIGQDAISVNYIDYGNSSSVQMSHLRTLPAEFAKTGAMALKCRLSGVLPPTKELNKIFTDIIVPDEMYEVKCVAMNVIPEVSLIGADGVGVLQQILKKLSPPIVALPTTSAVVVKPKKNSNHPAISNLGDSSSAFLPSKHEVYILYVKSPAKFWIQLKSDENIIKEIRSGLGPQFKESAERVLNPEVNRSYATEHPSFGGLYRALISSVNGDTAVASFIDYGDVHSIPIKNFYALPDRFEKLPALAYCCCMKRKEWSPEATNSFIKIVSNRGALFRAALEPLSENAVHKVEALFFGEKNIEKMIFTEVEASRSNQKIPSKRSTPLVMHPEPDSNASSASSTLEISREEVKICNRFLPKPEVKYQANQLISGAVSVSHVGSNNNLWLHLDGGVVDQLRSLIDTYVLQPQFSQLSKLPKPLPGNPCLVYHNTDHSWYRAIVEELATDCATVTYIDYGNTETVPLSKLHCLPAQLGEWPPMALKCALDGPVNIFGKLTMEEIKSVFRRQIFEAIFIHQTPDHVVVQLLDFDKVDLMDKITDLNNKRIAEEQKKNTAVEQDDKKMPPLVKETTPDSSLELTNAFSESTLVMKDAGDKTSLITIPVGNSFVEDVEPVLEPKVGSHESSCEIDLISFSDESNLTHQRIEDIALTPTSPTAEFFREIVPNLLLALDEETEKENLGENQDVCREDPSECGIVEKDSIPVDESEHKVTSFLIEAELSDTDLVDQPTAKVGEQAASSVLVEENARKAVDEKPPVFQIVTDDSCATGLLENQTTSKMLDFYPFTGEVSKEGNKTAEGENPANPASPSGGNQELQQVVDHIIQDKNIECASLIAVEDPVDHDSAVPVGEQHEPVDPTVVETVEPVDPLLATQDTVVPTPEKEKPPTFAVEVKQEHVSLLTVSESLDSTIVDTDSKMPIEEDQSTPFLNDGSENEQYESLGIAPMESVEEKPTDPSFAIIPATEKEQFIVEDKEKAFDPLVTKKDDQDSTTGETESVAVVVLEEPQEVDHPVKQKTSFEGVKEPAVSSVTCNILSTRETEEGSVETSTFVVGDVLGLLSSPLSPKEGSLFEETSRESEEILVNEGAMPISMKTKPNSGDVLLSEVGLEEMENPLPPPTHPTETLLSLLEDDKEDQAGAITEGDVGSSDHLSGNNNRVDSF